MRSGRFSSDVVVVGAGIAGLATAWGLARRGATVTVVEREPVAFSGASGHNAGIFRPVEEDVVLSCLSRRHAALADELVGGRHGWLDARGLLVRARDEVLRRRRRLARRLGWRAVEHAGGLLFPEAGVVDGHALAMALQAALRRHRVTLRFESAVTSMARVRGRFMVETVTGPLAADAVVLAVGAGAAEVGALLGAALPVRPLRRTLAVLQAVEPSGHVVWDEERPVYFRAESGGVLTSPCDERAAESVDAAWRDLGLLGERLEPWPALASAEVRCWWSGLRTFTRDRRPVVGADGSVPGLFWCAALGGAGMSTGLTLGELAAKAVLGAPPPRALAPRRLSG